MRGIAGYQTQRSVRTLRDVSKSADTVRWQDKGIRIARLTRRTLAPLVSYQTWLASIHLVVGLGIAIVFFVVTVIGLALGVGLLPLFFLGIPVLAVSAWISGRFANLERRRFRFLLGAVIADTTVASGDGAWWRRFLRPLRAAATWKRQLYFLLRLPVSVIEFSLAMAVWSVPLALLAVPFYNASLPQDGPALGGLILQGPIWLGGMVLVGLALLLCAPLEIGGLTHADTLFARKLLGAGTRDRLTARVTELEINRSRLIGAATTERTRIERDLHDGAQQRLVSLAIELGRAQAKFNSDPVAAQALVNRAHAQAKLALVELRDLVRGVHPPVLSDRGLDAALSGLAALSAIPVTVDVELAQRPSLTTESIAYFVVAECLANLAKHSQARRASVQIRRTTDTLSVTVRDDGIGGADPSGMGLSGLADRVAGVDGSLRVDSPAGGPTIIEVLLPCA
jgi:signal transduction histidine kinase